MEVTGEPLLNEEEIKNDNHGIENSINRHEDSKNDLPIDNEEVLDSKEGIEGDVLGENKQLDSNGDEKTIDNVNNNFNEANEDERNSDLSNEEDDGEEDVVDDEDDDEDEDEDEDEGIDSPPILKYSRLSQLPPNFFNKDPISTSTFSDSVFIFASHSGFIHITDTKFCTIRTFKAHRASILSVYTDGHYFASGSIDGTIVIGSLKDENDIIAYDFKRPIHAVVLDKNYQKTKCFISGGTSGKIIYSGKNWLGQRTDTVLDNGNGAVVSLQIVDDILFWMNDSGITAFNLSSRKVVTTIDKPEDSLRSDLYWPRVSFPESDRLLIAWGNYIWSLRIFKQTSDGSSSILPSSATISFRSIQEKNVKVESLYKMDSLISGIVGFKDDLWMLLTYEPPIMDKDNKTKFGNPDLKLFNHSTGEIEFEEEIGLKNISGLGLNDYSLGVHIGENPRYFIMCARDAVIVEELQLEDRLKWFIDNGNYFEAWLMCEHLVGPLQRLNYGIQHADSLVTVNKWSELTDFLPKLLKFTSKQLVEIDTKSSIRTSLSSSNNEDEEYLKEICNQWVTWANIFINTGHIEDLTKIIPTSANLNISADIYDKILEYWIDVNTQKFCELVQSWKSDLYDVKKVESLIERALEEDSGNSEIRRCLVDLYVKTFEPNKAVPHMIVLRDYHIVKFLSDYHLIINFFKQLPEIISLRFDDQELNTLPIKKLHKKLDDIIDLLIDKRHEILPKDIINLFHSNNLSCINYFYLEKLIEVDDYLTNPFGGEIVYLYSQYNRPKLLPFLMKNSNYNIDKAIALCEENEFIEELVFLLGKIGENRKALMLIIDKLDDPETAINFAKHQNEKDAWNILLEYSMDKPEFIKALIECADELSNLYYDPIIILKKMPNDINVEGLSESIVKFSNNNDLNLLINQIILNIINKESKALFSDYKSEKLKGVYVDTEEKKFSDLLESFATILVIKNKEDGIRLEKEDETNKTNTSSQYTTLNNKLTRIKLLRNKLKLQL